MTNQPKPAIRSKELWGLATAIIGAILLYFGIDADVRFLSDGLQLAQDAPALVGAVLTVVGSLLKAYGRRAASQPLSGIIRSKAKRLDVRSSDIWNRRSLSRR